MSYVSFIIPDCGPTVNKLKFKLSFRMLLRVRPAVPAQIHFVLLKDPAAEDALPGKDQL
jgi:hypothetical protein